jgi:hypothetical protein
MGWNKECKCNRGIINFKHIRLKTDGSRIELKCTKCESLIGWWNTQTEKILPIKRKWSYEECLTLR